MALKSIYICTTDHAAVQWLYNNGVSGRVIDRLDRETVEGLYVAPGSVVIADRSDLSEEVIRRGHRFFLIGEARLTELTDGGTVPRSPEDIVSHILGSPSPVADDAAQSTADYYFDDTRYGGHKD